MRGLDALRGLAAIGVVIHHLEQSRLFFGLSTNWSNVGIFRLGGLGVSFFFVLSGFLITNLLLLEMKRNGRVDIRHFYTRRILRIWPLYFFITLISFFILPYMTILAIPGQSQEIAFFWQKLSLFLGLSAHLATTFYDPVPYGAVLWSVGVEEWFYLLWPLVFLGHPRLKYMSVITIIPLFVILRGTMNWDYSFYFLSQLRFDNIAVGAFAAMAFQADHIPWIRRTLDFSSSESTWTLFLVLLTFFLTAGIGFKSLDQPIYSTLFAVIILGAARSGRGGWVLNNSILSFAGKVSFGAYCYNWITLVLTLKLLMAFNVQSARTSHILHYVVGFGLTFGVAWLSYRWLEKPFLSLKDRDFAPRNGDHFTSEASSSPR
ncbi:acyltransferase [Bosea sp. 124]|uniref:acyltransferase family protein n=1 Tax=Bosea sp. 124 TaxID=2135642 RepID=UPI001AEC8780|nr:acyltransferase [Bosea sp. 124]